MKIQNDLNKIITDMEREFYSNFTHDWPPYWNEGKVDIEKVKSFLRTQIKKAYIQGEIAGTKWATKELDKLEITQQKKTILEEIE